ncbi:MAG: amidase [Myxococcota bacterium]
MKTAASAALQGDATDLLAAMAAKETSSEALLEHLLARIARFDGRINAVVAKAPEAARARAREADGARARGESWGPLHGLPMTVKDAFETPQMPTTSGARELRDYQATRPAEAVARLEAAGAIVFGKTNLPLYAGEWQSFNALHGTTNNPWNLTRTPGGSSGGSAASLAAGFTPLELGSDVGGSIRIPSHFCGVVGHKPTYGLIPLRGHIPGPPGMISEPDLAVAGPMARSVRDCELAFRTLVGPAPEHAAAWSLSLPEARTKALSELRVAVWIDDATCPLEADVRQALEKALAALQEAGLRTSRVVPFRLADHLDTYTLLLASLIGAGLPAKVRQRVRRLQPALSLAWKVKPPATPLPRHLEGLFLSHKDWLAANEARTRFAAEVTGFFEDVDVLLMPSAAWTAPPHAQKGEVLLRKIDVPSGKRPYVDHLPWVALATLAGAPATSVPVGLTAAGLPVGLQVVSAPYRDLTTLAFAREVERVVGPVGRPPGFGP